MREAKSEVDSLKKESEAMEQTNGCTTCTDVSHSYDGKAVCSRLLVRVDNRDQEQDRPIDCPKENQDVEVMEAFWKILVIGALNTNMKNASAKMFVDILKEIFLNGNFAAKILLPKYGLTETYCKPAKSYIEKNGGSINLSSQVTEIIYNGSSIKKVITMEKVYDEFDYVISAIPHFALEKLIADESIIKNPGFSYFVSTVDSVVYQHVFSTFYSPHYSGGQFRTSDTEIAIVK